MVGGILTGLLVLTILFGFVLGLKRGVGKASVRLITVVLAAVIAVFLTPVVSSALLNVNLSKLNLEINGVPIEKLGDSMVNVMLSYEGVGEALNASPTLKAMIVQLPVAFLSLFTFLLWFLVLRLLMLIIYKIICVVSFKKGVKPSVGSKWAGAGIGALQGIVVFAVLLIPFVGASTLAVDSIDVINNYQTTTAEANITEKSYDGELIAKVSETVADNGSATGDSGQVVENVQKYGSNITDYWFVKVLNVFGYKSISNASFDRLTTLTVQDEKTTLRVEVDAVCNVYARLVSLSGKNIESYTQKDITTLKEAIDFLFDSKIVSSVGQELIVGLSNAWTATEPSQFMQVVKPELSPSATKLLDEILINLKNDSKADLKTDLYAVVNMVDATRKSGLISLVKDGNDGDAILRAFGDGKVTADIIEAMAGGKAVKKSIPTFIQCGLDMVAPSIGIPQDYDSIPADRLTAKTDKFYELLTLAATRYNSSSKDATALQNLSDDFYNAFVFAGMKGNEYKTYVNQMVGDIDSHALVARPAFELYFNSYAVNPSTNLWVKPKLVTMEDLQITASADFIDWNKEKIYLNNIFSGLAKVLNSLGKAGEPIDVIDFASLGVAFNGIRDSQVLNEIDQDLIVSIMESDFMNGIEVGSAVIVNLRDDEKFEKMDFEAMFKTLQSSLKLAKDLKNLAEGVGELNPDTVCDLLDGLGNEAVGEVLKDLASEDNIKKAGADENTAKAVSKLVDAMAGEKVDEELPETEEERKAEADAVKSMIDAVKEDTGSTNKFFATQADADTFIDNLISSKYVYKATIAKGEALGFKNAEGTTNLSSEEQTFVNNKLATVSDATKVAEIKTMFGI